jgi:toxin-antitoxin system PIN domain toxin
MILPDVNVLIYAFRRDSARHDEYHSWLRRALAGPGAYGVSPQALASVVRICTHPGIFKTPSPLDQTLAFCADVLAPPQATLAHPGERHWEIFVDLCRRSKAKGNLVQDAWFAALAIEHGCEWITTDDDYRHFPGLRWRHPFD